MHYRIGHKSFGIDDIGPIELRMEREASDRRAARNEQGWQPKIPVTFRSVLDTGKYERRKGSVIWKKRDQI